MIDAFFTPIPENLWAPMKGKNQYIGGKIKLNSTAFPKLKKTQIKSLDWVNPQIYLENSFIN